MASRRAVPLLALAAALAACEPSLDLRQNPTSADFAIFDPSNGRIPLPNDLALQQVPASITSVAGCAAIPDPYARQVCAWKFAGGFPATMPVTIGFARGQLSEAGALSYAYPPAASALDLASVRVSGAALAPNVVIVDVTSAAAPAVVSAAKAFDAGSGKLTLTPVGGSWTAGHRYAVFLVGGATGPQTLVPGPVNAMPTFYVLRESIRSNRDLTQRENQGLFPSDPNLTAEQNAAIKAASGAALEPIRRAYLPLAALAAGVEAASCAGATVPPTCIRLPFGELASLQTFTVQP